MNGIASRSGPASKGRKPSPLAATDSALERPLRIAFLIRSLEVGGAERQLVELVRALDRRVFTPTVLTCYGGGAFESDLRDAGIEVLSLKKQGRWDNLGFLRRLRQSLRRIAPDVLHSYMTSANLFALAARSAAPRLRVVWGVRQSSFEPSAYGFPLNLIFAASLPLERHLARAADLVIPNSEAAADLLAAGGLAREKIVVVPNGIDCARFRPDPAARARVRASWTLDEGTKLIGLVGRLDPMKGHADFLEAAAALHKTHPMTRFLCVGEAREPLASQLRQQAEQLGLADSIIWAGQRRDMPDVYNALDIHVSASIGEGFSNAIAEAMASGIPCVATDVGDSAVLVGDCGHIVPASLPESFAEACAAILDRPDETRLELGHRCRDRIVSSYSLESMVRRTASIYRQLVEGAQLTGEIA